MGETEMEVKEKAPLIENYILFLSLSQKQLFYASCITLKGVNQYKFTETP